MAWIIQVTHLTPGGNGIEMVMKNTVAARKTATLPNTLDVLGNLVGLIKCETKRQEKRIATRIESKCKESSLESVIWWKWRAISSPDVKQMLISVFCHSISCLAWNLLTSSSSSFMVGRGRCCDSSCPALCQSRDTDSGIERIKPLITRAPFSMVFLCCML